jgi:hypothetical protein
MNRKRWLIAALIAVSTTSALFEALFYQRGMPSTPVTATLASVLSAFLIALWIDVDREDHPHVGRSFDYGYLVLTFLLPYLPYYLWRTRGSAGLLMLVGFLTLLSLGFLAQLLVYGWYHR